MSDSPDWNPFHALSRRVLREGAPLVLTEDVRALVLRTARVGLPRFRGQVR